MATPSAPQYAGRMHRWAALLAILAGCADRGAADSADPCAGAAVTWDNWGFAFFSSYCRSCHSADAPDRYDAPEGIDFDTLAQVRTWSAAIRSTTIDEGTMPVGGGVPDLELLRLDELLRCGL
jgi:uncharacterized membrane protein